MAFSIKFLKEPPEYLEPGEKAVHGQISIGDFEERFHASTEFWSEADYVTHWIAMLEALLGGPDNTTSALITDMHDPSSGGILTCWPLYRDGNRVYLHNNLLFLDQLPRPIKIENIGSYVPPRATSDEDGEKVSEWTTTLADLRDWLTELKKLHPTPDR